MASFRHCKRIAPSVHRDTPNGKADYTPQPTGRKDAPIHVRTEQDRRDMSKAIAAFMDSPLNTVNPQ